MVNKTLGTITLALLLVFLPFAVAAVQNDELVAGGGEGVFEVAGPVTHESVEAQPEVLEPEPQPPITSEPTQPVDPDTPVFVDISKRDDILKRITVLSETAGRGDRVLLPNGDKLADALEEILKQKGVGPNDLDKFIKLNNINVEEFNQDTRKMVTTVQATQYLTIDAFGHYQKGDLEAAERSLMLAEAQYNVYLYFEDKIANEIYSWKNLNEFKDAEEPREIPLARSAPTTDVEEEVSSNKPEEIAYDTDNEKQDKESETLILTGNVVAEPIALANEVAEEDFEEQEKEAKTQNSQKTTSEEGFFTGFFKWLGNLF